MTIPLRSELLRGAGWPLIIGAFLIFIAGSASAYLVMKNTFDRDISQLKESHTKDLKAVSDRAQEDTQKALNRLSESQRQVQALDKTYTEKLRNEEIINQRLRADLASGNRRLQFARADLATCQLTAGNHRTTAGLDDAAAVRLSGEAGLLIHDIRTGIISDRTKLSGLQDYVRDVVRECRRETVQ
ncbi:lysis system i-spanin subunit Rz [Morganella morganii]